MKNLLDACDTKLDCWTDEDLLTEYRLTGNREHFEALVYRYEKELYRFLFNRTGNRETAEDVFQATFFQVHLKSDQFESGRRFRPWLYRIAANQAIDFQRKNRRHQNLRLDQPAAGANEEGDSLAATLESELPTPAVSVESAEEARRLHAAVKNLPKVQREVVELVCFRSMTYRQAAVALDVPFKTVATRLNAAKKRLAAALGADRNF